MAFKPPRPLTCQQVADRLGVTDRWVRKLVQAGELEGFRVGKRSLRVPVSALEEFLAKNRTSAHTV